MNRVNLLSIILIFYPIILIAADRNYETNTSSYNPIYCPDTIICNKADQISYCNAGITPESNWDAIQVKSGRVLTSHYWLNKAVGPFHSDKVEQVECIYSDTMTGGGSKSILSIKSKQASNLEVFYTESSNWTFKVENSATPVGQCNAYGSTGFCPLKTQPAVTIFNININEINISINNTKIKKVPINQYAKINREVVAHYCKDLPECTFNITSIYDDTYGEIIIDMTDLRIQAVSIKDKTINIKKDKYFNGIEVQYSS